MIQSSIKEDYIDFDGYGLMEIATFSINCAAFLLK
jgi:hypothetical protein